MHKKIINTNSSNNVLKDLGGRTLQNLVVCTNIPAKIANEPNTAKTLLLDVGENYCINKIISINAFIYDNQNAYDDKHFALHNATLNDEKDAVVPTFKCHWHHDKQSSNVYAARKRYLTVSLTEESVKCIHPEFEDPHFKFVAEILIEPYAE